MKRLVVALLATLVTAIPADNTTYVAQTISVRQIRESQTLFKQAKIVAPATAAEEIDLLQSLVFTIDF